MEDTVGVGASLAEEEGEEAAGDLLGGSKGICADPESADDWKGGFYTFKGNGKGKDKKGEKTANGKGNGKDKAKRRDADIGLDADVELGENQSGEAGCDSRCMLVAEDSQCNSCGPEKNAQ